MSICGVVADPDRFNNKMEALRAAVRVSREWSALVSRKDCAKPLKTGPLVWPAAITTSSLAAYEKETGLRPFRETDADRATWSAYWKRLRALEPGQTIEATFIGLIRTKKKYQGRQLPNGMWVPVNAFGNMGAYFAELVVKSVRDIKVVPVDPDGGSTRK